MSLPKPELDDRTFEQLVREARGLIPVYAPEWTDHNLTDPGITLIDLFAWLTETSLYRLNLITEQHIRKYLQLLGVTPYSLRPATVNLTFETSSKVDIPRGSLVYAELEGKKIYFELEHSICLNHVEIERVITDEVTGVFDRTDANKEPEHFFAPFGDATLNGASLYLGFKNPSDVINLFIELYEDDLIPPGSHGDEPYYDFENAIFQWAVSTNNGWLKIDPLFDETRGFKYSGKIIFEGIDTTKWSARNLPFWEESLYWLRCRLIESHFEYPPRIRTIRVNTARAVHGRTIKEEEHFSGTGLPGQRYKLKHNPVINGTVELYIDGERWEERPDLYGSGPGDRHFVLNSREGIITFGDGLMGAVPPDGADIVVKQYRTGGGTEGNLPSVLQWTVMGYPSVKVINNSPATGGSDEESLEEARLRFLKDLKVPYRTVTSEDFEYIAKNTPGLRIARAKAFVKNKTVYIVIVPYTPLETFNRPPEPSDGMIDAVCRHIDRHRLVGTRFKVIKPNYIRVSVSMKVKAERGMDENFLRDEIIRNLNLYLHPVRGGRDGKGWPPGEPVYRSEIYRIVEGIDGVRCVMDVHLAGDRGARADSAGNLILPEGNSVVYPGEHSIVFLKEQERCRSNG